MRKKLQIFISSLYIDLQEERQAAVEAILASNNIPAGMELFKAGARKKIRQQMNLLLNQREKEFLEKYSSVFADKGQTKPPKSDTAKGKQVVIDDIQ